MAPNSLNSHNGAGRTVLSPPVVVIIHCDLGLKCLKTCPVQELNEANCREFIIPGL